MISRRKISYKITDSLRHYLYHYGRLSDIPLVYDDLTGFIGAIPYEDPNGDETLWLTVFYSPEVMEELRVKLTKVYATLKIGGDSSYHEHLVVDRIDLGEFGNSRPFRIKITNQFNDNSDYYYVKVADASRIYGLELEHILSPNRMNYIVNGDTLIENHVAGLPGDVFLGDLLQSKRINAVRIAKEFVKFNERCFIRLLGDMRSVNYVVDITPDFEEVQYRVRPIDFDQQSYEGKCKIYHSYNFSSNRNITRLSFKSLNRRTIRQYAEEERSQMSNRAASESLRLRGLLRIMKKEDLAPKENIDRLIRELNQIHKTDIFSECTNMGELTEKHIYYMLKL
ncbi:MAG: hypothetical protein ACSHX6_05420 [Akkermansiaceae bacterium]